MNYHSTLSTRTLMKLLGLGGIRRGSRGTGSAFHDIDEAISSPLAEWKRPWWVKLVNNPTVEIDWDRMQRFDGRKMMQVSFVDYVGKDRNRYLRDHRNKKTRQWILERKSGYTLADRALDLAGRTGTVDPTFLGAWKKSTHIGGVWAGHIFGPDELNVPRWNGSPEENARLVRAAIRHFGAGVVGMLWWTHARAIAVMWHVWLMGACTLALFTLTVQHFLASFAESEPRAAWIGALLMGVPSLILAGLTFWLILIT